MTAKSAAPAVGGRRTQGTPDLSIGADLIVFARIAAAAFLAVFILRADFPHRGLVSLVLGGAALSHFAWWALFVRRRNPITVRMAQLTLLGDTVGVGIAVVLTGGADSPAVLIWGPSIAVSAIWIGVRASMPVLGAALAFLLAAGILDTGVDIALTEAQDGTLAGFMLGLIVAHGGILAARHRSTVGALAAAEARARLDPLTGLGNRTVFEEQLCIEIERAGRYGHALAL